MAARAAAGSSAGASSSVAGAGERGREEVHTSPPPPPPASPAPPPPSARPAVCAPRPRAALSLSQGAGRAGACGAASDASACISARSPAGDMRISLTRLNRVLSCSFCNLHVGTARTWLQAWAIVERFSFLGRANFAMRSADQQWYWSAACDSKQGLLACSPSKEPCLCPSRARSNRLWRRACADLPGCSQQLLTRGARRARAPVGAPRERRRGQEAAARGTLRALRHLRQAAAEEGAPTAPAPGAGSPSRITQAPGRGAVARADCTASPLQLQFFFSGDNFYLIIS